MKLSKLEKYVIDMLCDDYFGLWEVISNDNYLVESGIGFDPGEIKKTVKNLIENDLIRMVRGNIQNNQVSILLKAEALSALQKDSNWKIPSNLEDVYALYATEMGEKEVTTDGLIINRT